MIDLNEVFREVHDRVIVRLCVIEDSLACSWMCLSDLATMIQYSCIALSNAKSTFKSNMVIHSNSENVLTISVGDARYHFDYFINCFYAACQHLASAAHHLENKIVDPLFEKYPSFSEVINKKLLGKESHKILKGLISETNCNIILQYRHKWLHRGIPVLVGEFRYARKKIWQENDDTKINYHLKVEKNGKVTTDAFGIKPDYDFEKLLVHGELALEYLNFQALQFINYYDKYFIKSGRAKINEEGDFVYI